MPVPVDTNSLGFFFPSSFLSHQTPVFQLLISQIPYKCFRCLLNWCFSVNGEDLTSDRLSKACDSGHIWTRFEWPSCFPSLLRSGACPCWWNSPIYEQAGSHREAMGHTRMSLLPTCVYVKNILSVFVGCLRLTHVHIQIHLQLSLKLFHNGAFSLFWVPRWLYNIHKCPVSDVVMCGRRQWEQDLSFLLFIGYVCLLVYLKSV